MTNTTAAHSAELTALITEALAQYADHHPNATDVRLVAAVEVEGRYAVVLEADHPGQDRWKGRTHYTGTRRYDGRLESFRAVSGDTKAVTRKLEADLRTGIDDDRILPQLTALIRNAGKADALVAPATIALGDVAYVYAMGQTRRGIVTKLTAAKVTVAYTTASSGGRVFRKAQDRADVLVDA